jgi:chemotaxis protein CheD
MDREGGKTVYLTQGEYKISADPQVRLATVLGSCVAACIWDPQARIGGMNHFLLPTGNEATGSLRYGAVSMEMLINSVLGNGGQRRNLQAKLFGGATMSTNLGRIGIANARFATDFLAEDGIPCLAQDLGGESARRVIFVPTTGQALVMRVRSTDVAAPLEAQSAIPERRTGEVSLF